MRNGDLDQKTTGCSHLRHFATHPDFTRCSVGRAIWQRILEDVAKEFGAVIDLEVFSTLSGEPCYRNYASLGFEPGHRLEISILRRLSLLMRREAS